LGNDKGDYMGQRIKVIFYILVAILACSILLFPACNNSNDSIPSSTKGNGVNTPTIQPSPPADDYVELVYFHRKNRCYSCQYAGDMTQYTAENYFRDELANDKLVFKMYNVQDSANAAIIDKYGAYGSSLFINIFVDGEDHIKHISDIWYHIGDDEEFTAVVKTEIEKALVNI
jgi:hypothetical protein